MKKIILTFTLFVLSFSLNANFSFNELKEKNENLYSFVNEWIGVKYKFGGEDKNGIDCSGFTQKLYEYVYGIKLPRTAKLQYKITERIKKINLAIGDLVFFRNKSKSTWHVGVYLMDGYFVHAQSVKTGVVISNLNSSHYTKTYYGGGKI